MCQRSPIPMYGCRMMPAVSLPIPSVPMPPAMKARDAFTHRFRHPPHAVAQAPGRINLIGEHIDYNGGPVLPIAINRSVAVAMSISRSDHSMLVALDLGCEYQVDLTQPLSPIARDTPAAFANYVLGVFDQFKQRGVNVPNIDILVCGDLPIGAGLSSSAAVEVAVATALEALCGVNISPVEKALLCQRAEHAFPGTSCGIMDMFVSVLAEEDHALLIDCRSQQCTTIPLPTDASSFLVFDTGVKHQLAGGEYTTRCDTCARVANIIGVESLRDATMRMIKRAHERGDLNDIESDCASHVVLEMVRTTLAAEALLAGDVARFAQQMFESHKPLRNLYRVSCAELDLIVDTVHHLRDAMNEPRLGARMTGAGFGGCAIVCAPESAVEAVRDVVLSRFEQEFARTPTSEVFQTPACKGAFLVEQ